MHRTTTIVPGWQTRSAIKLCDVCCNDDNKTKFYHLQVPVAQRTTWPGPERCWMTPKLAATAPLIPQWARASSAVLVPPSQKVQNEWSKWQLSASRGCTWPGGITGCGEKVKDITWDTCHSVASKSPHGPTEQRFHNKRKIEAYGLRAARNTALAVKRRQRNRSRREVSLARHGSSWHVLLVKCPCRQILWRRWVSGKTALVHGALEQPLPDVRLNSRDDQWEQLRRTRSWLHRELSRTLLLFLCM